MFPSSWLLHLDVLPMWWLYLRTKSFQIKWTLFSSISSLATPDWRPGQRKIQNSITTLTHTSWRQCVYETSLFLFSVYEGVPAFMCVHYRGTCCSPRPEEGIRSPRNWCERPLWAALWILGTQHRYATRAASALSQLSNLSNRLASNPSLYCALFTQLVRTYGSTEERLQLSLKWSMDPKQFWPKSQQYVLCVWINWF